MKNKIIFIVAYFLIPSPIQTMNPENKQSFKAYKGFLDNINTFLSHPEDPKNYSWYLKKAQENATFLISNIRITSKKNKIYKKKIDNFLDITFTLLFNEPNEIFLSELTSRLLTNIKTLKQNIQNPHISDIHEIEKNLSRYKNAQLPIKESIIFWEKIQNSLRRVYSKEKSVPIAIKTLLAVDIKRLAKDQKLYHFLNQTKLAMSLLYFNKYPLQLCSVLTSALTQEKLESQPGRNDAIMYLQILRTKIMKTEQNGLSQKAIAILDDIKTKILNNRFTTQDQDFITALCDQISHKQDQPSFQLKKESSVEKNSESKIHLRERVKNFFKSVGNTTTAIKNRIISFFTPTGK